MSYRVYFTIFADFKDEIFYPMTSKVEYQKVYEFDNDIDAIKQYQELRGYGCSQYYSQFLDDENYFGFATHSIGGLGLAVYIKKWDDFDLYRQDKIFFMDKEWETLDSIFPILCPDKEDELYWFYMADGWTYICVTRTHEDYELPTLIKYKDLVIFGEEPYNNKNNDDDLPF